MRRVKSDPSIVSHAPTKLARKSVSCAALHDLHHPVILPLKESLSETIFQAPISVSGPCVEQYGFPDDILKSKNGDAKAKDFMECILSPPDPPEVPKINPISPHTEDEVTAKFERLLRGVIARRRKKT